MEQRQVKKITWQAKRECEKDMAKNSKHNSKAFFKYIKGKEKVRTSVGPLRNSTGRVVKALSHLDDLASVCRLMKNLSKTLAHVEYVMGKFCIR